MSQNKVVSITIHPKYRDVAALRRYLTEGQTDFGTKVSMDHYFDLKDPEVQRQLTELNLWCDALKDMPNGILPKPVLMDLSDVLELPINMPDDAFKDAVMLHYDGPPPIDMEPHLIKNMHPITPTYGKGFNLPPMMIPLTPLNPFQVWSDPPRGAMFTGGLKKGDFYNHAVRPPMPWDSQTPLHHMSRNQNGITIRLDNTYKVRGRDDANPTS